MSSLKKGRKRALFVCLTDYQIISALNVKLHLLKDEPADLILLNHKSAVIIDKNADKQIKMARRLAETGIFTNISLFQEKVAGLHKYFRNLSEGKSEFTFLAAVKNSYNNAYNKFLGRFESLGANINRWRIFGPVVDFSSYDRIFAMPNNHFAKVCTFAVLAGTERDRCSIITLDEGVSAYLSNGLGEEGRWTDTSYLYAPSMATYKDKGIKLVAIPQIRSDDWEFIKILNYIFDFKVDKKLNLRNRVVFFDQTWDAMPKYLQNLTGLRKILLGNLYKKHLRESMLYDAKIKAFRLLSEHFAPAKAWVKLHPRSNKEFLADYKKYDAHFMPQIAVPWELFGCNYAIIGNIWVTIYSSSLCSYEFTIADAKSSNKYIFLYKFILQDLSEYNEIDAFFKAFRQGREDRVFIPESWEEYIALLEKLKNEVSA